MSPDTVTFLLGLLNQLTLGTGAPDFEETAMAVIKARRELSALAPEPDA